ncbi:MAG: DUF433 domain-containing protein [Bacteroidota bacterium]
MEAETLSRYVVRKPSLLHGEPVIDGTRTPVRAIVELWRGGLAAEAIPDRFHLNMAQVFDALSYYSDHQAEINAYIEQNRIPDAMIDPLVRDL